MDEEEIEESASNDDSEDSENEEPSEEKPDDEMKESDINIKRIALKLFKYWSKKELRNAWREYVF